MNAIGVFLFPWNMADLEVKLSLADLSIFQGFKDYS